MIEVSGQPGSGKSTFLKNKNKVVQKKWYLEFLWPLIAMYTLLFEYTIFLYILRKIIFLQRTKLEKINIIRNIFIKLLFYYFYSKKHDWFVDEGISHIPFLLDFTSDRDFSDFIHLFSKYCRNIDLVFIDADEIIIKKRLLKRGHKRIRNDSELSFFFEQQNLIKSLYLHHFPLVFRSYKKVDNS